MALSKRSFANLEAIEDSEVREALRILHDRIHDLETPVASPLKDVPDPMDKGDALSLGFADNRYEPYKLANVPVQSSAVTKLIGLGLTEEEARSLL